MGAGTAIFFCTHHPQRVNKLLLVAAAGLPNPMPLIGRFFNLPAIGEVFLSLNTDAIRHKAIRDFFIHNKRLVTKSYFENVTRIHKIKHSTEIGLAIQRKQFFDKLSTEIHQLAEMEVPTLLVWEGKTKQLPFSAARRCIAF